MKGVYPVKRLISGFSITSLVGEEPPNAGTEKSKEFFPLTLVKAIIVKWKIKRKEG